MSVDDKYTYPGSGGVLVNAAGISDKRQRDEAMNDVASITMAEVRAERVPDRPDYAYLCGIHDRMFRDVDLQTTGTGIPYCRSGRQTLFVRLGVAARTAIVDGFRTDQRMRPAALVP